MTVVSTAEHVSLEDFSSMISGTALLGVFVGATPLYSMAGQVLQSVENRSATDWREPKTLRLGVGRYLVTALAPRVGLVSVPVVIGEEQITVVDLNHEVLPGLSVAGEQWVRLPNGQVIGSKAAVVQ